jgi:hypothetical protein
MAAAWKRGTLKTLAIGTSVAPGGWAVREQLGPGLGAQLRMAGHLLRTLLRR